MGRVCLYLCFSVKQKLASFLNPATENFHRHIECTWYRQTSTSFVLGIKERGKKLLIWNEQQIQTQIHNSRYKKPQSNKCYIATHTAWTTFHIAYANDTKQPLMPDTNDNVSVNFFVLLLLSLFKWQSKYGGRTVGVKETDAK